MPFDPDIVKIKKMDENGQYKIIHVWMNLVKIINIWMIIVYLSL